MHLLFISSNRIGDSLINLQVLNKYIRKYKKNIEVTLVSGPLPMPIYDDYSTSFVEQPYIFKFRVV